MSTEAMRIHKDWAIAFLRKYPGDLRKVFPEWDGTADELITRLNDDPAEYLDELGKQ
jgi:hypothetical protein